MSVMSSSSSVRALPAVGQLLDFSAALADVARSWRSEPELTRLLSAVVRDATIIVPGVRRASISVRTSKRNIDVAARTDGVIAAADDLQNELQQGPAIDAVARHDSFRTGALETDGRWPVFGPRAAALELRAPCWRCRSTWSACGSAR